MKKNVCERERLVFAALIHRFMVGDINASLKPEIQITFRTLIVFSRSSQPSRIGPKNIIEKNPCLLAETDKDHMLFRTHSRHRYMLKNHLMNQFTLGWWVLNPTWTHIQLRSSFSRTSCLLPVTHCTSGGGVSVGVPDVPSAARLRARWAWTCHSVTVSGISTWIHFAFLSC